MGDIILSMLAKITGGWMGSTATLLTTEVSQYSAAAYDLAKNLNTVAVTPVAAVIVAIMVVLELARNSSRIEADSQLGAKIIAGTMFKAALLVIVLQVSWDFIEAINEIGDQLAAKAADFVQLGPQSNEGAALSEDVKAAINDAGNAEKTAVILILFVPWLVAIVASIAVKIIVILRFAEIYVLSAAVVLPLAFASHPETRSIAVGYLRKYGAVVLQGFMLIVIFGVYAMLQSNVLGNPLDSIANDPGGILSGIVNSIGDMLLAPLTLIFLMFGSSRLARALVGE